jgi:hypothetical protein
MDLSYHRYLLKKKRKRSGETFNIMQPILFNEETPLLHQVNPSRLHQLEVAKEEETKSKMAWYCTLLVIIMVFLSVAGLCAQPVRNTCLDGIKVLQRTPQLFEFDLIFSGTNSNFKDVIVDVVDLEIVAAGFDTLPIRIPKELLGHVRNFSQSLVFKPISISQFTTARVSLVKPHNTLGRLIYMRYPFTLFITGDLYYSFLNIFQYSVPICSYFYIFDDNITPANPCQ